MKSLTETEKIKVTEGDVLINKGPNGFQVITTIGDYQIAADNLSDKDAAEAYAKANYPRAQIIDLT